MLAMRRASWESNAKARADPFGGSGDIGEPPSSLSPQTLGYARRLREEPNSWYDGDGKDLPYPLVAQEFVTDADLFKWWGPNTKRTMTRRRANNNLYKRRIFEDEVQKCDVEWHLPQEIRGYEDNSNPHIAWVSREVRAAGLTEALVARRAERRRSQ